MTKKGSDSDVEDSHSDSDAENSLGQGPGYSGLCFGFGLRRGGLDYNTD